MHILDLGLQQIHQALLDKKITIEELVQES